VVYALGLDLFTFLKMKSPIKMRICGKPCSVSASGLLGSKDTDMFWAINEKEKGFKLFLNLERLPDINVPSGFTLPTIVMDLPFSSKEEYEKACVMSTDAVTKKRGISLMRSRLSVPAVPALENMNTCFIWMF
jgi:hypothetical protein